MKRALYTLAAGLVAVACSDSAPSAALTSIGPAAGNDSGTSANDASAASDADPDVDVDGGQDAGADVRLPDPSVCDPKMTLGAPAPVVSTNADDRFGAISADELTVAWTVPSGGSATLQIADRASTSEAFGAPHSPSELVALDGVALAPSGLTLVAIATNSRAFLVFQRESRTEPFVLGEASAYDPLASALEPSEKVGDPVFAYGDQVLVYSVYGTSSGSSDDTVRYATRLSSGSPWDAAGALAFPELRAQGSLRRRPSGVGNDFQTLFFFDEISGTQKLGRFAGTVAFHEIHDLGARAFAQPNGDCTRVYYGAAGDIVSSLVQ